MLTYRNIKAETSFADVIWNVEEGFPAWFVAASKAWHPTKEDFLTFWDECGEIWGLFRVQYGAEPVHKLLAVVYLEFPPDKPYWTNIHTSVVDPELPEDDLVKFFRSLKNTKAAEGVQVMQAWIVGRNRALLRIVRRVGFEETGFEMTFGSYKGRSLRWREVRG
jgi:hypothetical protein